MKYSIKCPLRNQSMSIDAESDDAAVTAFMEEGKSHMKEQHPNAPALPDEQMQAMIRFGMKKEE